MKEQYLAQIKIQIVKQIYLIRLLNLNFASMIVTSMIEALAQGKQKIDEPISF